MAHVYISFLGTNDYLPCRYVLNGQSSGSVRFVQEALMNFCCRTWQPDDRILIFTTPFASSRNWIDNGHMDRKTGNVPERKGIKRCLADMNLPAPVKQISIPDGKTENEIWDIFNIVFEHLQTEDELTIDITHAFRSIPLLALVVVNYARAMKHITLRGIYYGALEVLGGIEQAKKLPPDKRLVPVFDLTAFDSLMEWSYAVDRFIESGDARSVGRLAERSARTLLSQTRGKARFAHPMRQMAKNLDEFTKAMSTCRGLDISRIAGHLKENILRMEEHEQMQPKPFQPVFRQIRDKMEPFCGDSISDGIQAARWCANHNLIQQGYTILEEILISYFIKKAGFDPEDLNNKNREIASQAVTIYLKQYPQTLWHKPATDHPETTRKFLSFYASCEDLIQSFKEISNLRNDLNHAGFRSEAMKATRFEQKLSELIHNAENHIKP